MVGGPPTSDRHRAGRRPGREAWLPRSSPSVQLLIVALLDRRLGRRHLRRSRTRASGRCPSPSPPWPTPRRRPARTPHANAHSTRTPDPRVKSLYASHRSLRLVLPLSMTLSGTLGGGCQRRGLVRKGPTMNQRPRQTRLLWHKCVGAARPHDHGGRDPPRGARIVLTVRPGICHITNSSGQL